MNIKTALAAATLAIIAAATAQGMAQAQDMTIQYNCGTYAGNQQTSRGTALTRSLTWIQERVPYSQSACHQNQYGNYRTDCSGYVSMIWGLRQSYTTSTMNEVSHTIARGDLRPGDALNRPGEHVALFIGWADAAHTQARVREQAGPNGAPTVERTWSAATTNSYTPIRYNNIVDDQAPPTGGSSLTGDGKADIAAVLADGQVKAWRNGAGFAAMPWDAEAIVASGFTNENLHFADLDGDGDKEIITVLADGSVKAWRNGGTFKDMPWDADAIIASGFTNQNLHLADLDGDGKADIATALADGQVKAWHNGAGFHEMPWDADAIIASGFTNEGLHLI